MKGEWKGDVSIVSAWRYSFVVAVASRRARARALNEALFFALLALVAALVLGAALGDRVLVAHSCYRVSRKLI